jgi:hypothetical protein
LNASGPASDADPTQDVSARALTTSTSDADPTQDVSARALTTSTSDDASERPLKKLRRLRDGPLSTERTTTPVTDQDMFRSGSNATGHVEYSPSSPSFSAGSNAPHVEYSPSSPSFSCELTNHTQSTSLSCSSFRSLASGWLSAQTIAQTMAPTIAQTMAQTIAQTMAQTIAQTILHGCAFRDGLLRRTTAAVFRDRHRRP